MLNRPHPLFRAIAVAALLWSPFTGASAQTNSFSNGTIFTSPALTTSFTGGEQMAGMLVSWQFVGGGTVFSSTWGLLSGSTWGVGGAGQVTVSFTGASTFDTPWTISNGTQDLLSWVRFNGAPGRTLFDCGWDGTACWNTGSPVSPEGTLNSARGWSLESDGGTFDGDVFGYYTNRVGFGGNAPVGDEFEQLTIVFGGGLASGDTYNFLADTDNSPFDAPPPTSDVVPEPASMTLLATGLAGLAAARRRRQGKS